MEVSDANNVKIYNLSAGKSLPEWLSDRKRRALQKKDVDIQRRIELIQDFDMPAVSTNVKMSPDGQFILATGIYKPRVKCYDVNNLSIKFERCFDSEVVNFQVLSDDYSKLVFLQCDRHVEFHCAPGRYYRLRIPKFGRDLQYHYPTCDLFIVGLGFDINRLNLERGQFLSPFVSESNEINKCALSPEHGLVIVGTKDGKVEAWDPRARARVGVLDCALACSNRGTAIGTTFPSITALAFENALTMAVGTATGQVALYDVRANKPFIIKDHMYGLPIKNIDFNTNLNLVLSMDSAVVKIWDKTSGNNFTSIEGKAEFNDLCCVKNSGIMFIANESVKVQTLYVPSLGPAPKWCGFLDSLTEELEESKMNLLYDDYKFITKAELEDLGLSHLLGTNLLRAYMHGYFIDIRLYKKAKAISDPFAFDKYRKKKMREKIEEQRANRVQLRKLPAVNRDLAVKLMGETDRGKGALLTDQRFSSLFSNPDFTIDTNAEEYRLINPVLSKSTKANKKIKIDVVPEEFEEVEGKPSSDESSSSDDDEEVKEEIKKQYKMIRKERKEKEMEERAAEPRMFELKQGEQFRGLGRRTKQNRASLGERLTLEGKHKVSLKTGGGREIKFSLRKEKTGKPSGMRKPHHHERRRPPGRGTFTKMWKGSRVE